MYDYNYQEICSKIVTLEKKDSCYDGFAFHNKNSEICLNIDDDDNKNLCVAIIDNNANLCDNINVIKSKDRCFSMIAYKTEDKSICDNIVGSDKEQCIEVIDNL